MNELLDDIVFDEGFTEMLLLIGPPDYVEMVKDFLTTLKVYSYDDVDTMIFHKLSDSAISNDGLKESLNGMLTTIGITILKDLNIIVSSDAPVKLIGNILLAFYIVGNTDSALLPPLIEMLENDTATSVDKLCTLVSLHTTSTYTDCLAHVMDVSDRFVAVYLNGLEDQIETAIELDDDVLVEVELKFTILTALLNLSSDMTNTNMVRALMSGTTPSTEIKEHLSKLDPDNYDLETDPEVYISEIVSTLAYCATNKEEILEYYVDYFEDTMLQDIPEERLKIISGGVKLLIGKLNDKYRVFQV